MSTRASIASRITAPNASIRAECLSPPRGLEAVVPASRQARNQRTAVATPIPKRAAAAWRDSPPSTAAITRTRKSSDKDFPIVAAPRPAASMNQMGAVSGKRFS